MNKWAGKLESEDSKSNSPPKPERKTSKRIPVQATVKEVLSELVDGENISGKTLLERTNGKLTIKGFRSTTLQSALKAKQRIVKNEKI